MSERKKFCVYFCGTGTSCAPKLCLLFHDSSPQKIREVWKKLYGKDATGEIEITAAERFPFLLSDEDDFETFKTMAEDKYRLHPDNPLTVVLSKPGEQRLSHPYCTPSPENQVGSPIANKANVKSEDTKPADKGKDGRTWENSDEISSQNPRLNAGFHELGSSPVLNGHTAANVKELAFSSGEKEHQQVSPNSRYLQAREFSARIKREEGISEQSSPVGSQRDSVPPSEPNRETVPQASPIFVCPVPSTENELRLLQAISPVDLASSFALLSHRLEKELCYGSLIRRRETNQEMTSQVMHPLDSIDPSLAMQNNASLWLSHLGQRKISCETPLGMSYMLLSSQHQAPQQQEQALDFSKTQNKEMVTPGANSQEPEVKDATTTPHKQAFLPQRQQNSFVHSIQNQRLLRGSPSASAIIPLVSQQQVKPEAQSPTYNPRPSLLSGSISERQMRILAEVSGLSDRECSIFGLKYVEPRKQSSKTSKKKKKTKRMRSSPDLSNIEYHYEAAVGFSLLTEKGRDLLGVQSPHKSHWKHLLFAQTVCQTFVEDHRRSKYDEWSAEARDMYAICQPNSYSWSFLTLTKHGDVLCRRILSRIEKMREASEEEKLEWCPKEEVLDEAQKRAHERLRQLEKMARDRKNPNKTPKKRKPKKRKALSSQKNDIADEMIRVQWEETQERLKIMLDFKHYRTTQRNGSPHANQSSQNGLETLSEDDLNKAIAEAIEFGSHLEELMRESNDESGPKRRRQKSGTDWTVPQNGAACSVKKESCELVGEWNLQNEAQPSSSHNSGQSSEANTEANQLIASGLSDEERRAQIQRIFFEYARSQANIALNGQLGTEQRSEEPLALISNQGAIRAAIGALVNQSNLTPALHDIPNTSQETSSRRNTNHDDTDQQYGFL